ncbi:SIR2 family protein [Desulfospira joergensenii]|uniref:P-loop NTPase n=1 Tax=Desulfospira joergensenii TaxID=53329 RepID=UPI0003B7771A|nr:SIR2 family protein [Desulfospira joergensenii]
MVNPDFSKLDIKESYNEDSLNIALSKAHAKNTILFLGAGFSLGCYNKSGNELLLAKRLSRKICQLGGFEEDDDLTFSADYYLKYYDPAKLIGLLKKSFAVEKVAGFHENIASVNWRRVYTTNYDNAYEVAAGKVGRSIIPITLEESPTLYFGNRSICVHINGAIQTLDNETLENSFKLSESSYTKSDAFANSPWAYRFKKDLELCSQIIFVGYSLYDMEIKRLLVENDDIIRKTFFITREDVSIKSHHRLSAFGEVFPIGVQSFGELLKKTKPKQYPKSMRYLSALKKETLNLEEYYRDTEIRDFLLRGKCNINYVASSLTSKKSPYAIERVQVGEALNILKSQNIVIFHGAIANGKSVIVQQVMANLIIEGKQVYTVKDKEADFEKDIEKLAEMSETVYLVVDNFDDHLDIIRYFSTSLGDNGKLVLTERPQRYRRALKALQEFEIEPYTLNVDYLYSEEIKAIDKLVYEAGLWGNLASLNPEKRILYISDECESQISFILLEILKAPYVISLFKDAIYPIIEYPDTKKTVYAICLMQLVYPSECNKSFISDISESNHIYSQEFEERLKASSVFEIRGNEIITRSAILGVFILKNLYNSSYSIDQIVRIVEKIRRNRKSQTKEQKTLSSNIMKFATISAILPDVDKPSSYIEFYEKLKQEVPDVMGNPHFWLQFGMAVLSADHTDHLSDAERLFTFAYSKAENIPGYNTTYIDNQFARLNLLKAIQEKVPDESFQLFLKAHSILKNEESDKYKFRQAKLYIDYYEIRYNDLSIGDRVKFEHSLKLIIRQYEDFMLKLYHYGTVPPYHRKHLYEFKNIINQIVEQRNK